MKKADDLSERRKTADAAKALLLEKFKSRPAADDPDVLAKAAARQAVATARAEREAAKALELKLKREAQEAERELARQAAEAARIAAEEAAEAERAEIERLRPVKVQLTAAEQKAIRDARYAARKQRKQG